MTCQATSRSCTGPDISKANKKQKLSKTIFSAAGLQICSAGCASGPPVGASGKAAVFCFPCSRCQDFWPKQPRGYESSHRASSLVALLHVEKEATPCLVSAKAFPRRFTSREYTSSANGCAISTCEAWPIIASGKLSFHFHLQAFRILSNSVHRNGRLDSSVGTVQASRRYSFWWCSPLISHRLLRITCDFQISLLFVPSGRSHDAPNKVVRLVTFFG